MWSIRLLSKIYAREGELDSDRLLFANLINSFCEVAGVDVISRSSQAVTPVDLPHRRGLFSVAPLREAVCFWSKEQNDYPGAQVLPVNCVKPWANHWFNWDYFIPRLPSPPPRCGVKQADRNLNVARVCSKMQAYEGV